MTVLLVAAGLVALVAGAEALVRGAARLAQALGVSPLVVGLTVVAFGTSAPEMGVSVDAALAADPAIALGNVVGSNIFNVWGILGISALVAPLVVTVRMVRVEVPVMIAVSVFLLVLARDGLVSRGDGVLLLVALAGYLTYMVRTARGGGADSPEGEEGAPERSPGSRVVDLLWIAGGLVLLVLGSGWFLEGARETAALLGVDDRVVGLTLVAAGTSLPELATSVMAAWRGQRDIAVGNVVGSNIFNILAILGVTATATAAGVAVAPSAWSLDLPVMLVAALVCLPVFFTGARISRSEGALFVAAYVLYTTVLVLEAVGHPAGPLLRTGLVRIGLPAAGVVVLVACAGFGWRSRRGPPAAPGG